MMISSLSKRFGEWKFNQLLIVYERQTGSLAYFSVAVRNGKRKRTSFVDRSSTSSNMQAAMQGQTKLKVHGNLNKGAPESMKSN